MLRTPSAIEGQGGASSAEVKKAKGNMLMLRDQMADLAVDNGLKSTVASLLPTPNTMDHLPPCSAEKIAESKLRTPGGYANVRETVVNDLLPTPTTRDGKDSNTDYRRDGVVQTDTVARAIFSSKEGTLPDPSKWGKFALAISRWETLLGRSAPPPTKPDGKDGAHRLSSTFTEWMMGVPDGFITGVGLSRNEELKACGNGVVPQQAKLALQILLDNVLPPSLDDSAMLPTPTVMDQREGLTLRSVAVENLQRGLNRGIGLNHLAKNIGFDWQEGDTFDVVDKKVVKRDQE
jgi:DNA (cytosine-5)-methyltransferase 1